MLRVELMQDRWLDVFVELGRRTDVSWVKIINRDLCSRIYKQELRLTEETSLIVHPGIIRQSHLVRSIELGRHFS